MNKVSFKKWMLSRPNVKYIGKVAVFCLPADKLDEKIKSEIHDFLVVNYSAYTHESSEIEGYWAGSGGLVRDVHERYEVSFNGDENFRKFVDFLSEICRMIDEDSIYLTVADESYLIMGQW